MIRTVEEFSLTLGDIAERVGGVLKGESSLRITGVVSSDKSVESGDLFLAFPGAHSHGATFATNAIAQGAEAVMTDAEGAALLPDVPHIIVSNARISGATVAASLYRYPMRDIQSIGITGTNGKTTVTTLLYEIFEKVGRDTGLIGTVGNRIGRESLKSERTTPEACELQALAAVMREQHMRHLVMEVSSHSLEMKRMVGSHFSIVGFTNLSQDHLDFHHDMESYFQAKKQLFSHEYADSAFINIDTEYGQRLFESCEIQPTAISRFRNEATWHFKELHNTAFGMEFVIRGTGGILIESSTQLHGAFNADNLLMAIAIAAECGVDPIEIAALAPQLIGAPGRMQGVALGQPFKAIVDYAHSPDAVINVLESAREFTSGKIIAVLGCGGDRDKSKRPLMGKALIGGADIAIMTSDNPRSEEPSVILNEMSAGLSTAIVIEDRRAAIEKAIELAGPGDSVLVLGKGHELGQEMNGVIKAFDDRLEIARAIEAKK